MKYSMHCQFSELSSYVRCSHNSWIRLTKIAELATENHVTIYWNENCWNLELAFSFITANWADRNWEVGNAKTCVESVYGLTPIVSVIC